MKKAITLMLVMVFVVGCNSAHVTNAKNGNYQAKVTTMHCKLSPFKSIVVSGNIQVELVNGEPAIDTAEVKMDQYGCHASVVKQVLYIGNSETQYATTAKVAVPCLSSITVENNATIDARNIRANKLIVTAKDSGTINLDGQLNIDKIFQYGHGRINLGWVHSNRLLINGFDSGPIYLSGVVNKLDVKLVKDAMLNARYLRADRATVVVTDRAHAEVVVLDDLKAYAIDKSSIYYYKRPKHLTIVTRDSGNVLHLDWMR